MNGPMMKALFWPSIFTHSHTSFAFTVYVVLVGPGTLSVCAHVHVCVCVCATTYVCVCVFDAGGASTASCKGWSVSGEENRHPDRTSWNQLVWVECRIIQL